MVWRPYPLSEGLDSSASQIQGTRAPAVVGASLPVASRARARKASTFSAAGLSPSRKSLASGTRGTRAGSLALFAGTAGSLTSVLVGFSGTAANPVAARRKTIRKLINKTGVEKTGVHFVSLLVESYEHKCGFCLLRPN